MARQVQDMSGGYLDITTADETAGREMQDMAGGYVDVPTTASATWWGGSNANSWNRLVVNRDQNMSYLGDFATGVTIDTKSCSVQSTGAPTTLSGTPAISIYKDNSVAQSTSGVTLSADFDSVTGLNNLRIDTSASVTP